MKGGLGPPAGDPAVAPGDVLEAVLEVGAVDCPIVVVVAPVGRFCWVVTELRIYER